MLDGQPVIVVQSSLYPDEGKVTIQVNPENPMRFGLRLRNPFGHEGCLASRREIHIQLNGCTIPGKSDSNGYYLIQREWSLGDRVDLEFDIPITVQRFVNDQYGMIVRGPEVLSVDQCDNHEIDLDCLALFDGLALRNIAAVDGRRRYEGRVFADGILSRVVFTPYADCGGQNSRFRTAFPIYQDENL